MLTPAMFIDGTLPDVVGDLVGLGIAVATFFGLVWAAVTRAMRPIRDRLDEVRDLAADMHKERARVDDLTDQSQSIERRLEALERRVEDIYALIVTLIKPTQAPPRRRASKKGTPSD